MKVKEIITPKIVNLEKLPKSRPKRSLRPMQSMVAVRSLRPKTGVANFVKTHEEVTARD